jgi:hypothetical protein
VTIGICMPYQSDELLSSWLVRVAMAQGCDPLVLTGHFWPQRRVWTVDLDRGSVGSPVAGMALSDDALSNMTLRDIAARIMCPVSRAATWPWILAAGCRNRARHGGLQFCPCCLASDARPYYRRRWRLAWHTGCSIHDCTLLDHCDTCGAVLEPHRLTLADAHVAICANCKADLRNQTALPWSPWAAQFQCLSDEVLAREYGRYGGVALPASAWFSLARFVIALIRAAVRTGHERFRRVFAHLDLEQSLPKSPATGLALELLPVGERAALLALACRTLEEGPDALVHALSSAGITQCALQSVGGEIPMCLGSLVSIFPLGARNSRRRSPVIASHSRSRIAVERMVARLRRKVRR